MISYARLFKRPLLFRSFTGLTVSEFDSIYIGIESKYNEHERRRRLSNRKKRQRDVGAGRPFKLKVKERFLMLLIYYRLYIISHSHYQDSYLILTRVMFVEIYLSWNHW